MRKSKHSSCEDGKNGDTLARLKRLAPKELAELKRQVLVTFLKAEGKLHVLENRPKLRVIAGRK